MARKAFYLALAFALTLPFAAAAQRHVGPAADAANAFEVFGTVTAFTADYGFGMPALTVEDPALGTVVVGLGPVWYLQREDFSAAAGDGIELLAYPCSACSAPAVAAWVSNLTTEVFVELRDGEGYPLWMLRGGGRGGHPRCDLLGAGKASGNGHGDGNGQGDCDGQGDCTGDGTGPNGPGDGNGPNGPGDGNGPNGPGDGNGPNGPGDGSGPNGPGDGNGPNGPGDGNGDGNGPNGPGDGNGPNGPNGPGGQCGWASPDMSAVASISGMVVSVDAAPGEGLPLLVLATAEGDLVLVISPYHPIAAAGFLIEPGMALDVTYAPWAVGGEAVLATISITDPVTGLVIQLRDPETGYPISGGPGGPPW